MKIAIDCRMHNSAGIGTYLQGILPTLLSKKEHQYVLLGNVTALEQYKSENVEIISVGIPIFSVKELFAFPVKIVNKCEAFLTPNFNIPLGIKVPIYSFIHDVVYLDIKDLTSKIGYWVRKFYVKRAVRVSKKIFTVSQFSKKRIQAHIPTSKKIIVANCSVKNSVIAYEGTEKKKEKFILFVGNVKKHKGLEVLIKGWEFAKEKGFDKKLYIVGNKEGFKTTYSDFSFLEKEGVEFTGRISDDELYSYMQNATILVQPSMYEGFGLPPLEALYLGATCLLSDIDVFKELYSDFENCDFFKRGDFESLGERLLTMSVGKINQKERVLSKYSFKNSADLILSEML